MNPSPPDPGPAADEIAVPQQHAGQPDYRWVRRVLIVMPTCILVTIGAGHELLQKHFPWYLTNGPGDWIVVLLVLAGATACGFAHEHLRNLAYGQTLPRSRIDRIGDVLVYFVLQLLTVPILLFVLPVAVLTIVSLIRLVYHSFSQ